jgi:hypothetical protein
VEFVKSVCPSIVCSVWTGEQGKSARDTDHDDRAVRGLNGKIDDIMTVIYAGLLAITAWKCFIYPG